MYVQGRRFSSGSVGRREVVGGNNADGVERWTGKDSGWRSLSLRAVCNVLAGAVSGERNDALNNMYLIGGSLLVPSTPRPRLFDAAVDAPSILIVYDSGQHGVRPTEGGRCRRARTHLLSVS
jgi:hypothetical protein